jgi:uncharacterized protein (DUF697 family)
MGNYKVTIVAPLVALLAVVLHNVYGITLEAGVQEQIIAGISAIVMLGALLYGIFKNHKKEG